MQEERSQLLAQVPLTVSPFVNLPKPPTLPHNYTSLPSMLPPSILSPPHSIPSASGPSPQQASTPDLRAYVTSAQSTFSAHPSTIAAQNQALLNGLLTARRDAEQKVREWERSIDDRELQEKRRRAPGYLDSDAKILSPERTSGAGTAKGKEAVNIMDDDGDEPSVGKQGGKASDEDRQLGDMMDRAFGGFG